MPTKSKAQQRLMQGIAHGMKPRSAHAPSRAVAKEFVAADHQRGSTKLPERVGHAIVANKAAKDI